MGRSGRGPLSSPMALETARTRLSPVVGPEIATGIHCQAIGGLEWRCRPRPRGRGSWCPEPWRFSSALDFPNRREGGDPSPRYKAGGRWHR